MCNSQQWAYGLLDDLLSLLQSQVLALQAGCLLTYYREIGASTARKAEMSGRAVTSFRLQHGV